MLTRKANERGHNVISWLNSWHTFSFGHYYDPKWQGFHQLLVINEDYIAQEMGFGTHPHRDMEIITYLISGELRHQDSMGNIGIIKPGEIQVMSAGTGITHSEHNKLKNQETHLLQIWVKPNTLGLTPRYDQQKVFDTNEFNFLKVIAAPFGKDSTAVSLNANAQFWLGRYDQTVEIKFKPTLFSHYWIQIVKGEITFNDISYSRGDGIAINDNNSISLKIHTQGAEFLIIETA